MPQLYELNLRDYWNIFLKRKWLIFIAFVAIFLSIFFYTSIQTPYYRTSVLLKIDPYMELPSDVVFPATAPRYWGRRDELFDYRKQLTSRPVLKTALLELGWIKEKMPEREKNLAISKVIAGVTAVELEKSNMIRLYAMAQDPEDAARLANKIAQVFKKLNSDQKNQQVRNVRVFIEKNLNEVSEKLKVQEERLRTLTTQGAVGTGVNIVNQIHELEKKITELSTRFTNKHPDIKRLNEQIEQLKQELKDLPIEEFEYGILKRDVSINESLYTSLKQRLNEAQIKEAEKIDNVILINPAITPLTPFYPNKRRNYTVGAMLGIFFGVSIALITEHLDTSIGRVEDIENFIKVGVLGIIPYCTSSESGHIARKGLRKIFSRKNPDEQVVCEKASVFVLGQKSGSIFSEAFRILAVNIQVMFGEGGRIKNKMLMITSCNPEEGKTVTVSNLAVTMAQMGYKILIVDADSRRANIHKIFGLKTKEGGFLDILTGKINPDAGVKTATDLMLGTTIADKVMDSPWMNNLNILTAGSVFPNTINLFNSDKARDTLDYFKSKYDVILMDTSPVLAVSDPSILMPQADGILLVYKAGATSRLALRRAKTQIEGIRGKAALSGVILNNVRPEIGLDTYYYYSRRYYGEKEKPQAVNETRGEKRV